MDFDKKVVQGMIKKFSEKLENDKLMLAETEILERFTQRKAMSMAGADVNAMENMKKQIKGLKLSIKNSEEFIKYLTEQL